MNGLKSFLMVCVASWNVIPVMAQTLVNPNVESKTHPSMLVDSIVLSNAETRCFISVVNQRTEGDAWFCADEHITLEAPDTGLSYPMIRAKGIPICPKVHRFSLPGEKLSFLLVFPPIDSSVGEIDLIEHCADYCFSLKGIILDPELNQEFRQFEAALKEFQEGNFKKSLRIFEPLQQSKFTGENHYAYTLYILPVLYFKLGDTKRARIAYKNLEASTVNKHEYFMQKIHEYPFFSEMK